MILMRISNLITKVQIFLSLTNVFHSYFIKVPIDHSFYGFTGAINHLGCWENTRTLPCGVLRVDSVRDSPQAKLDSEINASFLSLT